ncbi:hypothetical protein Tco_0461436 [Tanacetum coccineum]
MEASALKSHGVDLLSHCKIRVGSGRNTRFWSDVWLGESRLSLAFPRLYALETFKECTVASKFQGTLFNTFRREVRGGAETQQLTQLQSLVETVILSNADDSWIWDLNGEGTFCVKDARNLIDELQCDRPPPGIICPRGVHVRMLVVPVCRDGGGLKMWLICFFFVRLLEMFVALFVDGGIFPGCKLVPLRNGLIGSLRFVWVPDEKCP